MSPRYLLTALAIAVILLSGALTGFLYRYYQNQNVTTRHTVSVLQRLQEIQRLEVLEAELVGHKVYRDAAYLGFNTNEFAILAKARALYGLDLQQLQIEGTPNGFKVVLPPVRVQELILNPDSVEFVGLKKGLFTGQDSFERLQREALSELQIELSQQAREPQFRVQAQRSARRILEALLRSLAPEAKDIGFYNAEGELLP
jgi:hypothetical protein